MHAQGYTQVRGPLARLLLGTHRVARRCAGRWPACCWARAGLRSGARASGPPFDLRAQIRQPLARPLICARARLRLDARASGSPFDMCTRKVTLRCASLWPACCWARAGLRSGARASGSPFDLRERSPVFRKSKGRGGTSPLEVDTNGCRITDNAYR